MGTWNAGLYDSDSAADLKNTLALLCKVPANGERLLDLLTELLGVSETTDAQYWLVVADQFEKRGLHSARVQAHALALIDDGIALAQARDSGADAAFLKKRASVLTELGARLRSPRPCKARKTPSKAPEMVLQTGEVYAFPTCGGRAWHPYRLADAAPFVADGWGALVVLDSGRVFDWLPWVALASLTVDSARKPSLADALAGQLIFHLQTDGAGRFVPKRAHAKGLGLERLGTVVLDPGLVAPHLSTMPVQAAIELDWTICYGAIKPESRHVPLGCCLASLIRI